MEILKFPDKRLLTKCKPVTEFSAGLKATLDEMYATMLKANGKGLAANQVGLDMRAFVMTTEDGYRLDIINPNIIESSKIFSPLKEACLSAPGDCLLASRPSWILVEYQNSNGVWTIFKFEGLDAVAFCHENDHLLGKAFFQSERIPQATRKKLEKKWGLK
jgi:peptide deformylase